MPVIIDDKQQGIFVAQQTARGAYVAPISASYIVTEGLKPSFNQSDKHTVTLDSLTRPVKKSFAVKKHHKLPFNVPISWGTAAPTASADLPAVNVLLQACGLAAPAEVAATTVAPIVPAHVLYTEEAATDSVKPVSISHRRQAKNNRHYERQMTDCFGTVGFSWKIGEVPKWIFEMIGAWKAMGAVVPLVGAVGTQITNIGQPSSALNTAGALLNNNPVCLAEMMINNLGRMKPEIIESLCGAGASMQVDTDASIDITYRHPDIEAEFNPDLYWNGTYPWAIAIKGDGALDVRSYVFSWEAMTAEGMGESDINGIVHIKTKLIPESPLNLQIF